MLIGRATFGPLITHKLKIRNRSRRLSTCFGNLKFSSFFNFPDNFSFCYDIIEKTFIYFSYKSRTTIKFEASKFHKSPENSSLSRTANRKTRDQATFDSHLLVVWKFLISRLRDFLRMILDSNFLSFFETQIWHLWFFENSRWTWSHSSKFENYPLISKLLTVFFLTDL